jgi:hypothetical protein
MRSFWLPPHPTALSSTAAGSSMIEGQALSADGRRLVFTSAASDLVANDTNSMRDVFLADLQAGLTHLISVGTNGAPLPGPSSLVGVSRDASVIAFASSNVVNGTNTRSIFIYNANSGTSTLGNVLPNGEISATIGDAALSPDGRHLAFRAATQGLINVRDLQAQATVPLGVPSSPVLILGFSPGGKYLVVRTGVSSYSLVDWRSNTVALTITRSLDYLTNGFSADDSVFVAPTSTTTANSSLLFFKPGTGTNATLVASNILTATISADGSTVAYQARTNALTADFHFYIYDVKTEISSPLQIGGTNAVFRTRGPIALSADGRFIAFATTNALAGAPVAGDFQDVFIYDRVLKTIALGTERLNPAERFGGAGPALLSADGRVMAFDSSAPDLAPNDRNFGGDVFVRRFAPIDTDSDGLEDGWETLQFGGLNAIADADADNDGISNRNEFRAGTNPNSAASRFEMKAGLGATRETLTITAPATIGRTYQLQHRASLGAGEWQNVSGPAVAFSNEVSFDASVSSQGTGFFRVGVLE